MCVLRRRFTPPRKTPSITPTVAAPFEDADRHARDALLDLAAASLLQCALDPKVGPENFMAAVLLLAQADDVPEGYIDAEKFHVALSAAVEHARGLIPPQNRKTERKVNKAFERIAARGRSYEAEDEPLTWAPLLKLAGPNLSRHLGCFRTDSNGTLA
jgi:hypothetical protein